MKLIVFFAPDWGFTKGGINVFNRLLCEKVGYFSSVNLVIACVAPNVADTDIFKAREKGIILVNVPDADIQNANPNSVCSYIWEEIKKERYEGINCLDDFEEVMLVGHDTYSDTIALEVKEYLKKCRCAIVHHQAYDHYYAMGNRNHQQALAKYAHQVNHLGRADIVLANGPTLLKSAKQLTKKGNSVFEIKTGLPEIPSEVRTKVLSKEYEEDDDILFRVVTFGRIEPESGDKKSNTVIKQTCLAVAAWAKFLDKYSNELSNSHRDSVFHLYGKEPNMNENKDLKKLINMPEYSMLKRYTICDFEYETDRDKLMSILSDYSVCLTLSLREGFGMTALEAVAVGVPVITSKKSGFYQALKEHGWENLVSCVDVQGDTENWPHFTKDDLDAVVTELYRIFKDEKSARDKTIKLKSHMEEAGYTWKASARQMLIDMGYEAEVYYIENKERYEKNIYEQINFINDMVTSDNFPLEPNDYFEGKYKLDDIVYKKLLGAIKISHDLCEFLEWVSEEDFTEDDYCIAKSEFFVRWNEYNELDWAEYFTRFGFINTKLLEMLSDERYCEGRVYLWNWFFNNALNGNAFVSKIVWDTFFSYSNVEFKCMLYCMENYRREYEMDSRTKKILYECTYSRVND